MLVSSLVVFCICLTIVSTASVACGVKWFSLSLSISILWTLWWLLLENNKFEPTPEDVEGSTIGSSKTLPEESEKRSLAAFLSSSQEKGAK